MKEIISKLFEDSFLYCPVRQKDSSKKDEIEITFINSVEAFLGYILLNDYIKKKKLVELF